MFQPTDISGCWFWLRADDISADSSNQVLSWPNAGYQNCTFSPNPVLLYENTFNHASLNNHSTMRSIGPVGLSTGLINDLPRTDKVTAIYLYKQNSPSVGAGLQYLFKGPENEGGFSDIHVFQSFLQLSNIWYFNTDFGGNSSFSGYLNDWIIRSDIIDDGIVTFKRNGFAMSSGVITTPLPDITAPPFNGQGTCTIGGSIGVGSGDFAEVIVYDNRISNLNITKVENYLKFKYFIGGIAAAPAFINGCNAGTSGQYEPKTTLYAHAVPASGGVDLYISKAYTISSGTPLYTAGVPVQSASVDLFTGSFLPSISSGTLYVLGNIASPSGITLYTASANSFNSNVFLYTNAAPVSSGNTQLFIHGRTLSDGNQPLYIQGLQNLSANNNTALFIATNTSSSNPAVSGIYSGCELYISGGSQGTPLPLFIQVDLQGSNNAGMNLFIDNHAANVSSTTDMFIRNSNIAFSGQTKMFVKGLGSLDGGSIGYGNMNLYIERWPAGMATLFMNSATAPSSAPLYISSANSFSASTTMVMSGGQQLMGTGNFPIYVDAGFIRNDDISVYTHGLPSSNNNSTFYTNGF